jgi:uncharacterized protein YjiS (DUF1127 family)
MDRATHPSDGPPTMVDAVLECGPTARDSDRPDGAARRALRVLVRWWSVRRGLRQAASLPDALLKDIGLTRAGAESAILHGGPRYFAEAPRREPTDRDCRS